MDRVRKPQKPNANSGDAVSHMANRCSLCGKHFKSRSHFDALCDYCWADNEMRPYVAFGTRHFLVN